MKLTSVNNIFAYTRRGCCSKKKTNLVLLFFVAFFFFFSFHIQSVVTKLPVKAFVEIYLFFI